MGTYLSGIGDQELPIADCQWAMGDGDGRWAMGNGQLAISNSI
jgi:hypothetical protein